MVLGPCVHDTWACRTSLLVPLRGMEGVQAPFSQLCRLCFRVLSGQSSCRCTESSRHHRKGLLSSLRVLLVSGPYLGPEVPQAFCQSP